MSSTPPAPAYLVYFNFGMNNVTLITHVASIVLMSHLIYCSIFKRRIMKVSGFSSSLYLFLSFHILCAVMVIPYHSYMFINWIYVQLGIQTGYNPYMLLLSGIPTGIYYGLSSASAFFLTLDRCFVLSFPIRYRGIVRRRFTQLSVAFLGVLSLIIVACLIMEIPYGTIHSGKALSCATFICVGANFSKVPAYIKFVFIAFNIMLMCFFLYTLRGNFSDKLNNRVVKITMILELALNALPIVGSTAFIMVTKLSFGNYYGELNGLLSALNVLCCAIFYTRTLIRQSNEPSLPLHFCDHVVINVGSVATETPAAVPCGIPKEKQHQAEHTNSTHQQAFSFFGTFPNQTKKSQANGPSREDRYPLRGLSTARSIPLLVNVVAATARQKTKPAKVTQYCECGILPPGHVQDQLATPGPAITANPTTPSLWRPRKPRTAKTRPDPPRF
ncbi:hypothetical protein DdX_07164 [Ditylenchus destructor]|uniref:7TM GPCR serpentine receptor class x (Srx) domain-containing protein n=1 Tax=Ditylenchus destructor TaxID=166010 RepID=A0AAD4N6V9_9BILA|nr:hypothetical protein DdX_07164 [Ditylenchus destructor]